MNQLAQKYPRIVAAAKRDLEDDTGEVVVVHELGHIAVKVSKSFFSLSAGRSCASPGRSSRSFTTLSMASAGSPTKPTARPSARR